MGTITDLVVLLVALIILWVIVSIPVFIAARAVTSGRPNKVSFGSAMGATLGGAIVYVIVLYGVSILLTALVGRGGFIVALILAIVAWLAVYKSSFQVGWFGALAIAILAAIVLIVINVILALVLGVTLPSFFHPF
jgi:hypothetical protein